MPELPEVEITKRKLEPLLLGRRILDLQNRKVLRLERRGKAILIYLSGGKILAFHQRMSGKLLVAEKNLGDKHVRYRFRLSSGKELIFHDIRKFGVVWFGPAKKILKDKYISSLGPDALAVSFAKFKKILKKHSGMLKPLFLRQNVFAGIGNIVADEVLWKAGLHPEREIRSLRELEIRNLFKALKFILRKSIRLGGTTMRDWLHPDATSGRYWPKRFVYQRKGEKCQTRLPDGQGCGKMIIRIKVVGRGTFVCPKCQKV